MAFYDMERDTRKVEEESWESFMWKIKELEEDRLIQSFLHALSLALVILLLKLKM